jgi:hypothetical protein
MKNIENLNINSPEYQAFKCFILQLKNLNNEYIEFKNDNKTFLGKPKKFDEFISEFIDTLNESKIIYNQCDDANSN